MSRVEYSRGFEDALELALLRIKGLKKGEDCRREIEYLLSLIKEKKYEYLEQMLQTLH
ncbi:MAG: hypothetical protein ACTSYM_06605 [Candidatus Baldrarchaeia archaeon]